MRFGLFTSLGAQTWPGVVNLWRHTCLAGTPDQIRERLHQLQEAGVGVLFIPSVFRPLAELRRDLDRFMAEIAPAFR